jgi:hypothetical protein
MWVRVCLSVVTVFVFVLDMLMIVQNVSVGMGHIVVHVLMAVLCCRCAAVIDCAVSIASVRDPRIMCNRPGPL